MQEGWNITQPFIQMDEQNPQPECVFIELRPAGNGV